jgi:hypothetical protein
VADEEGVVNSSLFRLWLQRERALLAAQVYTIYILYLVYKLNIVYK